MTGLLSGRQTVPLAPTSACLEGDTVVLTGLPLAKLPGTGAALEGETSCCLTFHACYLHPAKRSQPFSAAAPSGFIQLPSSYLVPICLEIKWLNPQLVLKSEGEREHFV